MEKKRAFSFYSIAKPICSIFFPHLLLIHALFSYSGKAQFITVDGWKFKNKFHICNSIYRYVGIHMDVHICVLTCKLRFHKHQARVAALIQYIPLSTKQWKSHLLYASLSLLFLLLIIVWYIICVKPIQFLFFCVFLCFSSSWIYPQHTFF